MPRLRVVRHGFPAVGIPVYDNRFGTATDANGWFTFAINSGNRRVYADSSKADDTGDGLSAATAKKTFVAAISVYLGTGYQPGDQLMIAGTGGRTYTDDGTTATLGGVAGISGIYPNAILSYDPADASNSAKYGKLVNPDAPIVTLSLGAGYCFLDHLSDNNNGNLAIQGIGFKSTVGGTSIIHDYRQDNLVYQNCTFNGVELSMDNAGSAFGLAQKINVSKCSFVGAWANGGNASNMFVAEKDGFWFQDNVVGHGGWKLGKSRDDDSSVGGPNVGGLGHGIYYHASCINGRFDRNVFFDSSEDGFNVRGSATCTANVSIDEPIAGYCTQISGSYTEAPNGTVVTSVDHLVMGGANISQNPATAPRGQGFYFRNAAIGTGLDNVLMIDNPIYGGVNNIAFIGDNGNSNLSGVTVTLNRITTYNYASSLDFISGAYPMTLSFTNSIMDELASGTGNSVWTLGTFPSAKTRSQIYTAMGYASKAALCNMMRYRPDLPWAQALISIAFPAYNKTTTYALVSPPDTTGITPATIYPTALVDLSFSVTSFTRGTAANSQMGNNGINSSFTASGLPAGFTLTGTVLIYDGSGTGSASGSFTVTETSLDGLGTHATTVGYSIT